MTVPSVSLELHRAVVAQHGSAFDVLREAHVILDGIIGPDGRKIVARLQDVAADRATNAALAERVQALEAALDKAADDIAFLRNFFEIQSKQYADKQIAAEADAARLRALIEQVEFVPPDGPSWSECAWCRKSYPAHAPDCQRQDALAGSEERA